jgi:hypothetical protein
MATSWELSGLTSMHQVGIGGEDLVLSILSTSALGAPATYFACMRFERLPGSRMLLKAYTTPRQLLFSALAIYWKEAQGWLKCM